MSATPEWSESFRRQHEQILVAHAAKDLLQLIGLYSDAAATLEAGGDIDEACFFATQAYVLALAEGDSRAAALRERLRAHGREE